MDKKHGYLGALLKEEKKFEQVDYVYTDINEAMEKVQELNKSANVQQKRYTAEDIAFLDNASDSLYWMFKEMVDSFSDFGFFKDKDYTKLLDVIIANIKIYNIEDDENTEEGGSDFDDT